MYIISDFNTILHKYILSLLYYVLNSKCPKMKDSERGRAGMNSAFWAKFKEDVFQIYFEIFKLLNSNTIFGDMWSYLFRERKI